MMTHFQSHISGEREKKIEMTPLIVGFSQQYLLNDSFCRCARCQGYKSEQMLNDNLQRTKYYCLILKFPGAEFHYDSYITVVQNV